MSSVSPRSAPSFAVTAAFRSTSRWIPDALLTRLEAYSRREISSGLTPAERDRRIAALADVFLDRVEIRFDGSRRRPRFEYLPARI